MSSRITIYAIQERGELGCWDLIGEAYADPKRADRRVSELRARHLFRNEKCYKKYFPIRGMDEEEFVQIVTDSNSSILDDYDESQGGIFGWEKLTLDSSEGDHE